MQLKFGVLSLSQRFPVNALIISLWKSAHPEIYLKLLMNKYCWGGGGSYTPDTHDTESLRLYVHALLWTIRTPIAMPCNFSRALGRYLIPFLWNLHQTYRYTQNVPPIKNRMFIIYTIIHQQTSKFVSVTAFLLRNSERHIGTMSVETQADVFACKFTYITYSRSKCRNGSLLLSIKT